MPWTGTISPDAQLSPAVTWLRGSVRFSVALELVAHVSGSHLLRLTVIAGISDDVGVAPLPAGARRPVAGALADQIKIQSVHATEHTTQLSPAVV